MTELQKIIKYIALTLAICLIVGIFTSIFSAFSVFTYIFDKNTQTASVEPSDTQTFSDIYELDVELSNYEFIIETGDTLSLSYDSSNKKVRVDGNKLIITEKNKPFSFQQEGYTVVLTVPKDYFFTEVSIEMGAGQLVIEELSTNLLSLELGAGDVDIRNLTAITSADIDGGAGELSVTNSEITGLDLDMGVGSLALDSKLIGNSTIDLGVGDSNLILRGTADDYRFDITKGLGEITIDGEKYSSFSNNTISGESNFVELNCGIGNVNVDFK